MIRVQILDETDGISHSTNTLGKGMNPIILPPAMTFAQSAEIVEYTDCTSAEE